VERLVKTYLSNNRQDWGRYTWMCHHPNVQKVNVGQTAEELYQTYNFSAKTSPFKLASTQVISKSFGITQQHDGMKTDPWKRHEGFKIID
jgi:hypothetical protein